MSIHNLRWTDPSNPILVRRHQKSHKYSVDGLSLVMRLAIEIEGSPDTLLNSRMPVMLDFYADWCAPCQEVSPVLAELAHEFEGKICLARVNVEAKPNTELVERYEVYKLPTVIFIRHDSEISRIVGAKSKDQYRTAVIETLKEDR